MSHNQSIFYKSLKIDNFQIFYKIGKFVKITQNRNIYEYLIRYKNNLKIIFFKYNTLKNIEFIRK
ncbi:hypothetical protein CCY99_07995 [Helicobacter sp. 16-1353]|nr:hypothetical protein CCY99_07995 [Helicobacter sp. 16-1353]